MSMSNIVRKTALFALTAAAACGGASPTVRMYSTQDMPAAEGVVQVATGENENTALEVKVRHLARPEKVAPAATTYVVWARARGANPQNLGALQVDKDLNGTLKTVTPLRTFEVFITAEPSPTAQTPSTEDLLSASVER